MHKLVVLDNSVKTCWEYNADATPILPQFSITKKFFAV